MLRSLRLLALFAAPVLLASCDSSSPRKADADPPTSSVEMRVVEEGAQTALRGERTFVARNQDEWLALWREHASFRVPPPGPPEIDWSHWMVVGVVAGQRPSPGYAISVARVERRDGRLRALIHETKPQPGTPQAAVLTTPYAFVAVTRSDAPVEFVRE